MNLQQSQIIQFPKIMDARGNLSFIQNMDHVPFEIKRTFWIYDVPGGMQRGGHAYKSEQEVIVALSGSFDVTIINLKGEKFTFCLNRSYFGLYLPPLHWRQMDNFSTNAVSMHISSSPFDENDYIRDLDTFLSMNQS